MAPVCTPALLDTTARGARTSAAVSVSLCGCVDVSVCVAGFVEVALYVCASACLFVCPLIGPNAVS